MELKVKVLKLRAGKPVVILHKKTANKISVDISERIVLNKGKKKIISIVDIATGMLKGDEIAVSDEVVKALNLREGDYVDISIAPHPESTHLIYRKLKCETLNEKELKKIISDIVKNALTEPEIAYFVSAIYNCGMSLKETEYLIKAIVGSGEKLRLRGKIVDKHCCGGVAGNRTTPIVVPICAAAGLRMPKTSSRAITSAAGTADVVECVAKVDFKVSEIKKIVKKTKACMVWGGALGLAAADDKIIRVEKLLNLDPEPQLLASIISKKISVDSEYVLIDIPYGKSAKTSRKKAVHLKNKFEKLGAYFNLKLKCVLTDGSQPIGNGIGPVLEIRDVLSVLRQDPERPMDLEKKSVILAGKIFEMTRKAKHGKGGKMAEKILKSGKALKKFEGIIKAQRGSLRDSKLKLGQHTKEIRANKSGKIQEIDNRKINFLARLLGCPADKKSGIYLYKNVNAKLTKGDVLMTFYSESEEKLKEALKFYKKVDPIKVG